MNQYTYDNMEPEPYTCGSICASCEEVYSEGDASWIEYEDITLCFCSPECKKHWKEDYDEDEINKIISEGP